MSRLSVDFSLFSFKRKALAVMIIAVLQQELLNYTKFLLLKLDALSSLQL